MGKKIAVISALWHEDIVNSAERSFINEMVAKGFAADAIDVIKVPGALEIPLVGQKLLEKGYDLAVGISFIVDGGIYHHQFVAQAVVDGIVNVSLKTGKPFLSVSISPQKHRFKEGHAEDNQWFVDHFVIKGREAANAADIMLALPL
jgi:6,7-dimethyl-8-ribityllumazine synthase